MSSVKVKRLKYQFHGCLRDAPAPLRSPCPPCGRHSSCPPPPLSSCPPLSLTCRIHGLMDELWRCKMAAQTMDGRRTYQCSKRERDRSNFTLFYTKAQLATAVRNAHSLGFSAIVEPGHNCDFLWNFQVERMYLRAESFKWS